MASTLMYEVNGMMPVAFSEVWRDAYVQQWAGRESKLYYRPVGTNCVSVCKLGATERTHAADDEALRAACKSMEPTLGWAETSNYRTIEGVHTLLEEESPLGTRSPIPVLIQMQGHKDVTGQQLVDWAKAAHVRAKHLGLTDESYFVALYALNAPIVENWKLRIPQGTIVIEHEALVQFLSPFGMTPLLKMLDANAD